MYRRASKLIYQSTLQLTRKNPPVLNNQVSTFKSSKIFKPFKKQVPAKPVKQSAQEPVIVQKESSWFAPMLGGFFLGRIFSDSSTTHPTESNKDYEATSNNYESSTRDYETITNNYEESNNDNYESPDYDSSSGDNDD